MASIADGANATISVAAGEILTVQSNLSEYIYENPVGTRIGQFGSDQTFGPYSAAGSVKVTSVQGPLYYEVATLGLGGDSGYNPAAVAITGGTVKVNDGTAAAPSYSFANAATLGFYNFSGNLGFSVSGVSRAAFGANLFFRPDVTFGWSSGDPQTVAGDTILARDAANTLAQRNGTNTQTFRVYSTYTDASNYERLNIKSDGTQFVIESAFAGTGVARSLAIASTADIIFSESGIAERWKIKSSTGSLQPATNGSVGIGSSGVGISKLYVDYTNTATVGAVTINKAAGRVNIAAAATSIVVTNSLVTAASKVIPVPAQADANNPQLNSVVPAAGSFTITVSPAPAANQAWDFFVVNTD